MHYWSNAVLSFLSAAAAAAAAVVAGALEILGLLDSLSVVVFDRSLVVVQLCYQDSGRTFFFGALKSAGKMALKIQGCCVSYLASEWSFVDGEVRNGLRIPFGRPHGRLLVSLILWNTFDLGLD